MNEICYVIVLVALAAAFVVLLVKKWGINEWMQIHGDKYIAQLFSCDLCMSFWAAVIPSMAVALVTDCGIYMAVPIFSTPISRMLV